MGLREGSFTHDVSNVSSFEVVIFQRENARIWTECSPGSL